MKTCKTCGCWGVCRYQSAKSDCKDWLPKAARLRRLAATLKGMATKSSKEGFKGWSGGHNQAEGLRTARRLLLRLLEVER